MLVAALVTGALALSVARGDAHKPITSPYTYNEDVFPILRDRCGRCHVSGGVAPMSLMTHADTVPWGESIRTELLAGQMPPWSVDSAPGRFHNVQGLTPRELNTILTWVTGGTPLGDPDKSPPPMTHDNSWRLGAPDLTLPFPAEFTLLADARERTAELIIPTGITGGRRVRAIDLRPGRPEIVRAAQIFVRSSSSSLGGGAYNEPVLALWLPGDEPVALDEGLGFDLPPSSELVVHVLYRKTWEYERQEMRDRSTVGVYFAPTAATPLQALTLSPDTPDRRVFRRTLPNDVRVIGIYPNAGYTNTAVKVTAIRPDGTRAELIAFHPRPDWARRYWLREPVPLPLGTTIEVNASFDDEAPMLPLSAAPSAAARPDLSRLRVTLNIVPGR